jgi:hypothetical protein
VLVEVKSAKLEVKSELNVAPSILVTTIVPMSLPTARPKPGAYQKKKSMVNDPGGCLLTSTPGRLARNRPEPESSSIAYIPCSTYEVLSSVKAVTVNDVIFFVFEGEGPISYVPPPNPSGTLKLRLIARTSIGSERFRGAEHGDLFCKSIYETGVCVGGEKNEIALLLPAGGYSNPFVVHKYLASSRICERSRRLMER